MPQTKNKIYYYHLKKCGGTTLNSWLGMLTPDGESWKSVYAQELIPGFMTPETRQQYESVARLTPYLGRIIYDHAPLSKHVGHDTFRFSLLRSPIPRLLSQIKDWRRLDASFVRVVDPQLASTIEAVQKESLHEFLNAYAQSPAGALLNNYQVKALAASTLGLDAYGISDMEYLLDVALKALHENFDFIGIAEKQDICRNLIARHIGTPPVFELANLNTTSPDAVMESELAEANDALVACTRYDSILYEEAKKLFNQHVSNETNYDFHEFERTLASPTLGQMKGYPRDGGVAFSVRDPLYGQGFYARDAANTPNCAVWAGPSTTTLLYMPVLPDVCVEVMLWVRGYADENIRNDLQLFLDGEKVTFDRQPAAGAAEVLVAKFKSTRSFVRLEIKALQTVSTQDGDARKRSFCFDAYGWRII